MILLEAKNINVNSAAKDGRTALSIAETWVQAGIKDPDSHLGRGLHINQSILEKLKQAGANLD